MNARGEDLGRGWVLCEKGDFERLDFPEGWHCRENKVREMVVIEFLVRVNEAMRVQINFQEVSVGISVGSFAGFYFNAR